MRKKNQSYSPNSDDEMSLYAKIQANLMIFRKNKKFLKPY